MSLPGRFAVVGVPKDPENLHGRRLVGMLARLLAPQYRK